MFTFFSLTGIPPTTTTSTTTAKTPPLNEQETRAPKALKGWFENPYLIKQQPNFEAFIEASRNSAIQNMSKKLETNHSISDEPGAFFSGMLTYCVPKCVHFAAVILEINFQFLVYM